MNRIYQALSCDDFFKDKLFFDESKDCLIIIFNEYLRLDYFEGSYASARDEGLINLNNSLTHWHITTDEEVLEILTGIGHGDVIFIEDTGRFALNRLRLFDRKKFDTRKERLMAKKSLRIYTGNSIIKRDEK